MSGRPPRRRLPPVLAIEEEELVDQMTLGIDVACRAAHQASLADGSGRFAWTGRRFRTTSVDLERLWSLVPAGPGGGLRGAARGPARARARALPPRRRPRAPGCAIPHPRRPGGGAGGPGYQVRLWRPAGGRGPAPRRRGAGGERRTPRPGER